MNEEKRTDNIALGMLIVSCKFGIHMGPSSKNGSGYLIYPYMKIYTRERSSLAKDLMREYLHKKDILVNEDPEKWTVRKEESLWALIDMLSPWRDFMNREWPFEAIKYVLTHKPPVDDSEEFRRYITHVDSIL